MNTTRLPQPIYELVQTLLNVRNTLEDVRLDAASLVGRYGDAPHIEVGAIEMLNKIDEVLDLIKYNE